MKKQQWLPVIAGVKRSAIRTGLLLCLFASVPLHAHNANANMLNFVATSGRIIGDEGRARLVMDFDKEPDFEVHYLNNPPRVVVDFPDVDYRFDAEALTARGLFTDIRFGAMAAGRSRVVLTSSKPLKVEAAEVIADKASDSFRFVLDAERTTAEIFAKLIAEQTWDSTSNVTTSSVANIPALGGSPSDFIVAIDAGHGGIDAGARGAKSGTDEKTITLSFAKDLAASINAVPGMKAVLTRDKDVFLALSERVALARQQGAKLLISVHADTLRQKDIRGATVYTLSDKASDRMAQALAERENKSDQLAGITVMDSQPEVADILIDLTRRETQAFSITLAERVLKSFSGHVNLINNPHRHAGFQVLRAHDVPSVLLELGFLSNAEDEKLLLDEDWRKRVAERITEAVGAYKQQAYVETR